MISAFHGFAPQAQAVSKQMRLRPGFPAAGAFLAPPARGWTDASTVSAWREQGRGKMRTASKLPCANLMRIILVGKTMSAKNCRSHAGGATA